MNEIALESFISYCDNMMIANESMKSIGNNIMKGIKKAIEWIINKIKELKRKVSRNSSKNTMGIDYYDCYDNITPLISTFSIVADELHGISLTLYQCYGSPSYRVSPKVMRMMKDIENRWHNADHQLSRIEGTIQEVDERIRCAMKLSHPRKVKYDVVNGCCDRLRNIADISSIDNTTSWLFSVINEIDDGEKFLRKCEEYLTLSSRFLHAVENAINLLESILQSEHMQ